MSLTTYLTHGLVGFKGPLFSLRLLPSTAITHNGPSSHSSSLSPLSYSHWAVSWVRSHEPLRLPFLQIYWLTANLSIRHIPNYRLQSAWWQQQNKEVKRRGLLILKRVGDVNYFSLSTHNCYTESECGLCCGLTLCAWKSRFWFSWFPSWSS